MKALIEIQAKLVAPKSQYNSFGKYNYRNLEDILEGLKPLLDDNGCTLVISDSIKMVGDRVYVKAKATITDSEGNKVKSTGFAREPLDRKGMDESQITGAASSYARKYALNGLFCIDDNKDADSVLNLTQAELDSFSDLVENGQGATLYLMQKNDMDKYISLANKAAPKGSKMAFKEKLGELTKSAFQVAEETANQLVNCLDNSDVIGMSELVDELDRDEKILVWSELKPDQQQSIKQALAV